MPFSVIDSVVGNPQISLSGLTNDTTAGRMQPGQILTASDNWWGTGEFIFARAAASIRAFGLCTLLPVFDATLNAYRFDAVEVANTANLGQMLCVSQQALTVGQYSWFMVSGLTPVNGTATVAAGATYGITAAGQVGANSVGKQVVNSRISAAATTTVAKVGANASNGVTVLQVPSSDGWFVGAYLSGTGIQAGTTIASIDPSGRYVTLSVATNAAIVGGTITATYNNGIVFYNVAHLNRSFAQGAIT